MAMYGFESIWFNMKDGFLEAIVRGHRAGFLGSNDYNNLCQCESLDDIKLNMVRPMRGEPRLPSSPAAATVWMPRSAAMRGLLALS